MVTMDPNKSGARIMVKNPIPDARIALISLSSASLPKVIRVASKTAMGTDRARIQARFKDKYSRIVIILRPFPRNRSTARRKKLTNRMKVIIPRENRKGKTISRKKYLDSSRMVKITPIEVSVPPDFLLEVW
tara:strand:+ start:236 stop:631 length:396 start_codon:yes stop_codon:yes gene_type:complete